MTCLLLILALNLGAPSTVTVAPGEQLNVRIAGEGPPIVLLPGLAGCAYGFRHLVPELQDRGFQVLVIEPLAFGSSSKPREADYSLTAQAGRVAAVLDALDVKSAVVLGHGVAVSISLRLALSRPDLVEAVVALEGGAAESAATAKVEKSLKLASVVAKLGGKRVLRDQFASDLKSASGDPSWVTGITVRKYFAPVSRDMQASIDALRAMARAPEPVLLGENLHRIQCPVLLLTGGAEHSGSLPPQGLVRLGEGLRHFTHREVPGAGHYLFEEKPQAVVEALLSVAGAAVAARAGTRLSAGGSAVAATASSQGGLPCAR